MRVANNMPMFKNQDKVIFNLFCFIACNSLQLFAILLLCVMATEYGRRQTGGLPVTIYIFATSLTNNLHIKY